MDLQGVIENYGYATILFGTFLEGETILFGHALELVIGKVKHYEVQVFGLIALLGLLVWAVYFYRRRKT